MCSRSIGDYILLKSIGKGAFSEVFLAEHKPTQTYAAVKQIAKNSSYVVDHLVQLKAEISIMKRCDHPYISKFYEVMEDDDNIYLTQEYVEGGNLLNYFNSNQDVDEHIIKKLFIQILYALDYLHNEIKIIHRDIKMENILLDQNNNVRIIDFGLCCPIPEEKTVSEPTVNGGSPAYVAPEMILGLPYSEAVDVWALGIILFAMSHSFLPFDDPNINRLFRKIVTINVKCRKDLDPQIVDLINKMLNKEPNKRISISQIFEHPWIAPSLSLYNPEISLSFVDTEVIFNKLIQSGYNVDNVKNALVNNEITKGVIMYNILHRNLLKRAFARSTELGKSLPRQRSVPAIAKDGALPFEKDQKPKDGSRSAKPLTTLSPPKPKPHSIHVSPVRRNSLNSSLKENVLGRKRLSSLTLSKDDIVQAKSKPPIPSPTRTSALRSQRNSLPPNDLSPKTSRRAHF